jgi:hypothetical protein
MIEICSCVNYDFCDNKFNISTSNLDEELNIVFDDKEEKDKFQGDYSHYPPTFKSLKEYYEESINCISLREYYENVQHLSHHMCCGGGGTGYIVLFPKFIFSYTICHDGVYGHSSPCIFLLYDNLDYNECVNQIDKYLDTIIYRGRYEPSIKLSESKLDLDPKYIKAGNIRNYCIIEECLNVITDIKY